MIDDSRQEHRMLIFGNDSDPVQEHLCIGQGSSQTGILERKMHSQSYTVTLYALLKDYGLTPIVRIKPRIRFHRSSYDNLSSSAPLSYSLGDIVDFAELKRGVQQQTALENTELERIFADAPTIENLSTNPALQLVAQGDVFLRAPAFKTKTKVFGEGSDIEGIPIGQFLEALNRPSQTEAIFRSFPSGREFARDLLEAIAPFEGLEFQFRLYSRYERRDCVLSGTSTRPVDGYRTTFDPWTVLGYIRSIGNAQQLQVLSHERGTRWEHKLLVKSLDSDSVARISREIRMLRHRFLIGRALSKSQTALTLLAQTRESQLNLTKDILIGRELTIERPLHTDRFANIGDRQALRAAFTEQEPYQLYPLDADIIERHLNLAKGTNHGLIYTLNNVFLTQGPPPKITKTGSLRIVTSPVLDRVVIRSAEDLRMRLPADSFDKCWNEVIHEAGYSVMSAKSSRCYSVSYCQRFKGSCLDGKVDNTSLEFYLLIKYLGISPEGYQRINANRRVRPDSALETDQERAVIREIQDLFLFLKQKQLD